MSHSSKFPPVKLLRYTVVAYVMHRLYTLAISTKYLRYLLIKKFLQLLLVSLGHLPVLCNYIMNFSDHAW